MHDERSAFADALARTAIPELPDEVVAPTPEHTLQEVHRIAAAVMGPQAPADGLLVAAATHGDVSVGFHPWTAGTARAWVVGRHERCHIRLRPRARAAGLRHALLWAVWNHGQPTLRVIDLRSTAGVEVLGLGAVPAADIGGPGAIRLGDALLFFAPCRAGDQFVDALPPDLLERSPRLVDATDEPGPTTPPQSAAHSSAYTAVSVRAAPAVVPLPREGAAPHKGPGVTLSRSPFRMESEEGSDGTPPLCHVDWPRLRQGVIFGRYSRCDRGLGAPRSNFLSRLHLGLFALQHHVYAIDLASTNGTTLGHMPLRCARLAQGNVLHLAHDLELWAVHISSPDASG